MGLKITNEKKKSLSSVTKLGQERKSPKKVLNCDIQTLRNPELCENYMKRKRVNKYYLRLKNKRFPNLVWNRTNGVLTSDKNGDPEKNKDEVKNSFSFKRF